MAVPGSCLNGRRVSEVTQVKAQGEVKWWCEVCLIYTPIFVTALLCIIILFILIKSLFDIDHGCLVTSTNKENNINGFSHKLDWLGLVWLSTLSHPSVVHIKQQIKHYSKTKEKGLFILFSLGCSRFENFSVCCFHNLLD